MLRGSYWGDNALVPKTNFIKTCHVSPQSKVRSSNLKSDTAWPPPVVSLSFLISFLCVGLVLGFWVSRILAALGVCTRGLTANLAAIYCHRVGRFLLMSLICHSCFLFVSCHVHVFVPCPFLKSMLGGDSFC